MCLHGGLVLADRPCPLICQSAVSNLPQDPGTENPQQCGGVSERQVKTGLLQIRISFPACLLT